MHATRSTSDMIICYALHSGQQVNNDVLTVHCQLFLHILFCSFFTYSFAVKALLVRGDLVKHI